MTTEEAAKAVVDEWHAFATNGKSILDDDAWGRLPDAIDDLSDALSASPWVSCKVPPTPDDGERVIVRFDSGLVDVWHTKRWDWQGLIRLGLKEWMRVPADPLDADTPITPTGGLRRE